MTEPSHLIDTYGFDAWGRGLFAVMDNGDLGLCDPERPDQSPVSLPSIVDDLDNRGVSAPVVIRVQAFLRHRIAELNEAFCSAISELEYAGSYRSVFPIKVNQQADVVDSVVEFGRRWEGGLEAGSKAELMIALSRDLPDDALIICNGVKDEDFVHLAISAGRIGVRCVIVLESAAELETVLRVSDRLGERPLLGVRIKLNERSSGPWASSSGDRSAFGVGASDLYAVVQRLADLEMLSCLVLQHSHVGSQIPDVNEIRRMASEAARFATALRSMGAPIELLDLGGGLGVDYTGEHRSDGGSINYSLTEYAANVVESVQYVFDDANEAHPTLVTESGRAMVASSSMLIFDVLDATSFDRGRRIVGEPGDHEFLTNLLAIHDYLDGDRLQECLSDAEYYRGELRENFRRGLLALDQLARGEDAYLGVVRRAREVADASADTSDAVRALLDEHVDIYHCNLSVFQSLPDSWAIGQIHPVTPIRRLNETPGRRAVLADTTCDSDGRLDSFVTADGVTSSLPVHDLVPGERYHLGVFLVGAYQETLGDLHNLFGDTHVVTVDLRPDGSYELLAETEGDTVSQVLSYVEYDPKSCLDAFKRRVDASVSRGEIDADQRRDLISIYRQSLSGYTYFEHRRT